MTTTSFWRSPTFALIAAAAIIFAAFGVRQSFGLFMQPISLDLGWGRETLSLAIATQNLIIGVTAPFAGALAARWGAPKTIALGGSVFALGILVMSQSMSPTTMMFGAGILAGLGLGACGMPLVLAVVAQVAPVEKRSVWLGIITACATGGQLLVVPISHSMLTGYDWVSALLLLSIMAAFIVPMAFSLSGSVTVATGRDNNITLREALAEAIHHRGFLLLTAGFYVCGFHVAFIAVHLPAYLIDQGATPALGATALMLIALFNMVGAWSSGWLSGRISKKYLLSSIYSTRAVVIGCFIVLPVTPLTVVIFSCAIGLLWLSTVPPTSGLVGQIFGVRYMGMLYGIVFLGHQLGSFTGVWLGGRIFDATGSYNAVWYGAVVLGLASALIHLPIDERPLLRTAEATV